MRSGFGQIILVWLLIAAGTAALAGCATSQEEPPAVVYREAKVAVATGCVVDKPEEVKPLNQRIAPDIWAALAPGAKAQAALAQAGDRMNYEDELRASTAGCQAAPSK